MRNIFFASLALAVIGTACDDGTKGTGDTSGGGTDFCDTCSPTIDAVNYNYDDIDFWYDVEMAGWSGDVELYIFETGSDVPWYEYGHLFPATDSFDNAPDDDTRGYYDPNGYWDHAYMLLGIVGAPGDVVPGSTTLFSASTESQMTWSVVTYDTAGAQVDCGSWGEDVTANEEGYDFGACTAL